MLSYFRNPKEIASSDVADDICELICAIMEMENFDARYKGIPPSSIKTHEYMELKRRIARRTAGRIAQGIDITKDVINAKLVGLLASCNQTLDLWIDPNSKIPTQKFTETFQTIHLTHVRRMRNNIFTEIAQRRLEYTGLHSSFHGIVI